MNDGLHDAAGFFDRRRGKCESQNRQIVVQYRRIEQGGAERFSRSRQLDDFRPVNQIVVDDLDRNGDGCGTGRNHHLSRNSQFVHITANHPHLQVTAKVERISRQRNRWALSVPNHGNIVRGKIGRRIHSELANITRRHREPKFDGIGNRIE